MFVDRVILNSRQRPAVDDPSPGLAADSSRDAVGTYFSSGPLDQTRQHGVLLLLVLVREQCPQGPLLALGPAAHVPDAKSDEDDDRPTAADEDDGYPSKNLEHVVGAGDQVATDALGDALLSSTRRPQAGQVVVDEEVGKLGIDPKSDGEVVHEPELCPRGERPRSINVVCRDEAT